MPAAYRDSICSANGASGSSIAVNPATLTYASGDVLVLHVWGYTSLGAPTGSDLTWTERLSRTQAGPFGNTDIHKVWTAVADASITSFTVANGAADSYGWTLTSVQGADTSSPVDASAINSTTYSGTADPTAPTVTTTGTDSLLIVGVGSWAGGSATRSFTPPTGMTEREDINNSYDSYSIATLGLSSAGATGTKVFLESPAESGGAAWIASSIAIKSAGGAAASGTGTITATGTLTSTGAKAASGTSTIAATATMTSSGVAATWWTDDFNTYGTGVALPSPWATQSGSTWMVYNDGSYHVAYETGAASAVAAWRPVPSVDHRVEATYKLAPSPYSVGGVTVRGTAATQFIGLELVKHEGGIGGVPTPESKVVIYKRSGGTDTDLESVNMSLAYEQTYTLRLQLFGATVVGYVDGVQVIDYDLTGPEQAQFTGTDVGMVNFSGAPNYLIVSASPSIQDESGTGTIAGTATLTALGGKNTSGTATVTASGSVTSAGSKGAVGNGYLDWDAELTGSGSPIIAKSGTATLTGSTVLTSVGVKGGAGTATLTGSGAVTTTGAKNGAGTAALVSPATVTGSGSGFTPTPGAGTGTVTATVFCNASGTKAVPGTAAFAESPVLTVQGFKGALGIAALTSTVSITGSGQSGSAPIHTAPDSRTFMVPAESRVFVVPRRSQ